MTEEAPPAAPAAPEAPSAPADPTTPAADAGAGAVESAFEPRIVGILCNWCSYAGADLAGISRIQYPPNLRVVRVMCSGRVDPELVLYTLMEGADGVLALGCHPGDCHYQTGNLEAKEKFEALLKVLRNVGLADRFRYEWVSASEGGRFAEVVTAFTEHIRAQGRTPLPADAALTSRLRAAIREMGDFRLRWLIGRQRRMLLQGDAYGEKVDPAEWDAVMECVLREQFVRAQIIEVALNGPVTVDELAKAIGVDASEVFRHVQRLRARGLVAIAGHRDRSPTYRATGAVCE